MTEILRISSCPLCNRKNCLHVNKSRFQIGKYTFLPGITSSDRICIQKSDGEGTEVSIEKLEKLLDEFWKGEF